MRPPSIFFEFGNVYILPAMVCRRGGGGVSVCVYIYIYTYIYIYIHIYIYVCYIIIISMSMLYVCFSTSTLSFIILCFHVCDSSLFVSMERMRNICKGYG